MSIVLKINYPDLHKNEILNANHHSAWKTSSISQAWIPMINVAAWNQYCTVSVCSLYVVYSRVYYSYSITLLWKKNNKVTYLIDWMGPEWQSPVITTVSSLSPPFGGHRSSIWISESQKSLPILYFTHTASSESWRRRGWPVWKTRGTGRHQLWEQLLRTLLQSNIKQII